ncbi:MAG: DNA cytosine methyltransferase [Acidobacteria bacterium]|nr:DNA cytosine methyltransferase [Acidobacteriota bacterium]
MDLGFRGGFQVFGKLYEPLPFHIVWANDLSPAACKTYKKNLEDVIHEGNIWECLEKLPKRADVVIGGFPCQDISINGKLAGVNGNDSRSGLYRAMLEVIKRCKPRAFVAENVKGLMQKYNRENLAKVVSDFSELGYNLSYNLYLAANYGVPQMRQRVFIVGTAQGVKPFRPPWPIMQKDEWLTSKKAIGDLEDREESEAINHIWSRAERSAEQGNRRIKADRPSDTIRAECHGNIQYHYSLPRRLSMREAARLQSFPDDFIFAAKLRETERQVGNAVPPVLAWHIAQAVRDCLS